METTILHLHTPLSMQPDREKTFLDVFREFNIIDARENDLKEKTAAKYDVFVRNFERYLEDHGWADLSCDELTIQLVKKFIYWLPDHVKSCGKTHKAKHLDRLRKAADYAVESGMMKTNPLLSYRLKRDKTKPIINLDGDEFHRWINHQWHLPVYTQAQDLYSMACASGMSYMDLFCYKTALAPLPARFQTEEKKTGLWIISTRGKGNRPFYVPLWHAEFSVALDLHIKYNGKMPFLENHFYNRLIREMAAQLGIDKYLNTHTGRKTFANLKDGDGWALPEISAVLGNTEKVAGTNYVDIQKKKIETALERRLGS